MASLPTMSWIVTRQPRHNHHRFWLFAEQIAMSNERPLARL
jgi:hypothetical protein